MNLGDVTLAKILKHRTPNLYCVLFSIRFVNKSMKLGSGKSSSIVLYYFFLDGLVTEKKVSGNRLTLVRPVLQFPEDESNDYANHHPL